MMPPLDIGRAFLLPRVSGPVRLEGRTGSYSPRSLAAAPGISGDSTALSPGFGAVAASASDRILPVSDRLGAARCLTRSITARAVELSTPPARAFSSGGFTMAAPKSRGGAKSKLADDATFRRLWSTGVPLSDIAESVDITPRSVTILARSYGYPYRSKTGELLGDMPRRLADHDEQESKIDARIQNLSQTHPRWPVEYDAAILKTEGKYSRIANLAKILGRSVNAVLGRWHQLRAM